jgi:hypothetical protein
MATKLVLPLEKNVLDPVTLYTLAVETVLGVIEILISFTMSRQVPLFKLVVKSIAIMKAVVSANVGGVNISSIIETIDPTK